jgi:hypothetical protein
MSVVINLIKDFINSSSTACAWGRTLFLACALPAFASNASAALTVYGLLCDGHPDPLGIDHPAPILSWKLKSPSRNQHQNRGQSAHFVI